MARSKTNKTAYVVVDDLGEEKRVFTTKSHGKEAEERAEEFAKKFGYKVK